MRLLTALLVAVLVFTFTPQLSQSDSTAEAAGKATSPTVGAEFAKANASSFSKEVSTKKTQESESSYIDGEAIVLVRSDAGAKSGVSVLGDLPFGAAGSFGKSDLPKGAVIKEKTHFDGSESADAVAGVQPGATVPAAEDAPKAQGSGGSIDAALLASGIDILKVKSDSLSTEKLIAQIKKNPKVLYAEPNYRIHTLATDDTFSSYQWDRENTGQDGGTPGKDVKPQAPLSAGKDGSGYVVAVVDTGFDFSHEDLQGVAWTNPYQAKLAGKHGYNFAYGNADPQDDHGHGTHVAGIIAALKNNGKGVSGLASGVKIMPLKIFDADGWGDTYTAIEAYEYIYQAMTLGVPVKAINNSWGGYEDGAGEILKAVIDRVGDKGALSICAAGNDYMEITDRNESVPASLESPYVISVAATTEKGELADFSNWSEAFVDLAAPGTSVLSTVSYPVYNPQLEKTKDPANQLSLNYLDFESGLGTDLKLLSCTDGSAFTTNPAIASIAADGDDFFGPSGGKSVEWTIPDGHEGELYNLYLPYEIPAGVSLGTPLNFHADYKVTAGPALYSDMYWGAIFLFSDAKLGAGDLLPSEYTDVDKILASSGIIGGTGMDEPQNRWLAVNETLRYDSSGAGERHALVFTYYVGNNAEHVISIDNIGISKANPLSAYDKYAFYSGTSMATPLVTASVALTAQGNSAYNASKAADTPNATRKLAAKVRSMASPEPALAGKVKTGGILDLSLYKDSGKPSIESAEISGSNVKLNGFFFGSSAGTVEASVGGASLGVVAPVSGGWKDSDITLPGAKLKNRFVDFTLTRSSDGAKAKASLYVVGGKDAFASEGEFSADIASGSLDFTTDGKTIYFMGNDGILFHQEVYTYDDSEGKIDGYAARTEKMWIPSEGIDRNAVFTGASESQLTNGVVSIEGGLPYVNGKFYGIATLVSGAVTEYALVSYDVATNKWTRLSDRPGAEVSGSPTAGWANLRGTTLGAYNGKLYLIGGYDGGTDKASALVRIFDPATNKWSAGPSLPSGRFNAVARQVGDKLLVALGGDGAADESKTPDILVFDGRTWTAAPGISGTYTGAVEYYESKPYFKAAVGVVSGGLIFSGLAADGLGDTYTYNIATKQYAASTYQLSQNLNNAGVSGIAVGGAFYASSETTPGYWFYDEYTGISFYIPGKMELFKIDVPSGLHTVTGVYSGGFVQGYGSYLPGETVTLQAEPEEGYYFKNFTIDGKTVQSASYSFTVTKNTKADAVFAKYTTKVALNKKTINLKPGKSLNLKATVSGAVNGVKGVVWKSSNNKYATVSQTGKVTAKKAGLGKLVIITATAKDGSQKYATATIRIFTHKITGITLKAKSKQVKVGKSLKIAASFKPTKGVLKTLSWKVNKPQYASVSPTGTLYALSAGKGKTVTVTAYARDGSKKKASIKIKIK
ncbi:MAG: S8 family serine peptidase [Clostridiales Family XIII bacterium]|nr:S8 family serine peptidase [Clostridiales Family XIII bacterium]